jgi:hypothetical protein
MPDHGGLMLAARITFAHISISAAMRVANSHAPPRVHHAAQRVGNHGAYPAQLQALLRAKGIDAQVINARVRQRGMHGQLASHHVFD